ncbi:MAG: hypothetical protein WA989_14600 [Henriciella sp.]|uniref:hypothetical protein n=1 Tax=Henriciella sp. TaxID=1968823 RepID=UPI003C7168E1
MAEHKHSMESRRYYGGQIGLAVVAVSVCTACGVAWLSGGDDASLSYAPAGTERSEPAETTAGTPEARIDVQRPDAASDDDRVRVATADNSVPQYTLIVRFDDEPVLDEIGRSFRKDPDAARARFARWAAGKSALRGLRLERASYAGELVLTNSGPRSRDQAIAEIEAMDNIAYVEPDYSAEASKEG